MERRRFSGVVAAGLCAGCLGFREPDENENEDKDETDASQSINRDLTREGRSIPEGSELEFEPAWEYAREPFEAIRAGDDLILQDVRTGLRRVTTDGDIRFRYSEFLEDGHETSFKGSYRRPFHEDDRGIFFGSWIGEKEDETRIYALDPETGDKKWMFEHGQGRIQQVTRSTDSVFYAIDEPREDRSTIHGRDAETGEHLWEVSLDEDSITNLHAVSNRLAIQDVFSLQLRDTDSGNLIEERSISNGFASSAHRDGVMFTTDNGGETLLALHLPSGEERWRHDITYEVEPAPAIGTTSVVYATSSGHVLARNINTGEALWRARTPGEVVNQPITENGIVWVPSNQSALTAFNEQTGEELTHIEFDRVFASFAVQNDVLIDTVRDSPYRITVVEP